MGEVVRPPQAVTLQTEVTLDMAFPKPRDPGAWVKEEPAPIAPTPAVDHPGGLYSQDRTQGAGPCETGWGLSPPPLPPPACPGSSTEAQTEGSGLNQVRAWDRVNRARPVPARQAHCPTWAGPG